jgi:hypothetical protein
VTLQELGTAIPNLSTWSHADRIRLFAWFVHTQERRDIFTQSDIRRCYETLHFAPTGFGSYLIGMVDRKEATKKGGGFVLTHQVREKFDKAYGVRSATTTLLKAIEELPGKVSSAIERTFLDETLICLKHGAYRAAVVMAWNLAYDHLLEHVVTKHLTTFNAAIPKRYPKKVGLSVNTKDEFQELKEWEVLEIANTAGIISGSLFKVLKEKLDRRNVSAHPSGIVVGQATAEDCIQDLVDNVVLKLI